MDSLPTLIGGFAALCTTASYLPQIRKCWRTNSAGDLSLRMLLILIAGISAWVIYGLLRGDRIIIAANSASMLFLLIILYFRLREEMRGRT